MEEISGDARKGPSLVAATGSKGELTRNKKNRQIEFKLVKLEASSEESGMQSLLAMPGRSV